MKVPVIVLFVLALSTAAPVAGASPLTGDDLRIAVRFEEQGRHLEAAEAYAKMLRLEPGNQKAKKGLARVGDRAVDERVATAADLEESGRFADAGDELGRAQAMVDRMAAAGIATAAGEQVAVTLGALTTRWVASLEIEAVRALEDGLWSVAIGHLRQIESLRPDSGDVRRRLTEAWAAWGRQDLHEGRYRAAAERFMEAARVPGAKADVASRQAAAIMARLGEDAVGRGACRRAVADLRVATQLELDAVDAGLLARAEACAVTCLVVAVISEIEVGLEADRVERFRTDIRGRLAAEGTEFLRIDERSSAPREPCGLDLSSTSTSGSTARWFRAAVAITSQSVLREPATSRTREFRSRRAIDKHTVVENTVVVRQYEEVFSGSMTGSVTLTDRRTGSVSPAIPIRVTAEETAVWIKELPTSVVGGPVPLGITSAGTALNPELQRLARIDEQRRDARARLGERLLDEFAAEAARIAREMVDSEPDVAPPAVIHLPAELFESSTGGE